MKWATCRILGSSGSVKGIEKLKNYGKLKARLWPLKEVQDDG
jgi:hypothetical protein